MYIDQGTVQGGKCMVTTILDSETYYAYTKGGSGKAITILEFTVVS